MQPTEHCIQMFVKDKKIHEARAFKIKEFRLMYLKSMVLFTLYLNKQDFLACWQNSQHKIEEKGSGTFRETP
jgi:hypothetical protein